MNLPELRAYLETLMPSLSTGDRRLLAARLESLTSVFPFNEYEYILSFLLARQAITFEQYAELRRAYVADNRYLGLFELAPRIFGQVWGERHLMDLDSRFVKPSPRTHPGYDGAYDLELGPLKIEVKAARAINTQARGSIVSRGLRYGSGEPFWMNFQQLKTDACDAFVFIGVWVDRLVYWVLSSREVAEHPLLSHQHRGGVEYQIGINHRNIRQFDGFLTDAGSLADAIIARCA